MANLRDQEARNRIWGEQRDVVINIDSGDDEDGGCCPECGAELPDCPTCHQSMPMCPQCGAQVDETGPTRPGVVGMATRAAGKGGQFAKGGGHVPGAGGKPGRSGLAVAAGTPSSQWSPGTWKGLQAHQAGGASSKAGAASPVSGPHGAAARIADRRKMGGLTSEDIAKLPKGRQAQFHASNDAAKTAAKSGDMKAAYSHTVAATAVLGTTSNGSRTPVAHMYMNNTFNALKIDPVLHGPGGKARVDKVIADTRKVLGPKSQADFAAHVAATKAKSAAKLAKNPGMYGRPDKGVGKN